MRRVTYAGESFLTTDEMAEALVKFTAEIARNTFSEPVSIPVMDGSGKRVIVDLVIGPTSEVISVPDDATSTIDIGTAAVQLQQRVSALSSARMPHNALPLDEEPPTIDADAL